MHFFPVLLGIASGVMTAGALYICMSAYERQADRALNRCFKWLHLQKSKNPGDVVVRYSTYHGFLLLCHKTSNEAIVPGAEGIALLGRLLRFNLTWGLASLWTIPLVPVFCTQYFRQRRLVHTQWKSRTLYRADPSNPVSLSN
jgi:hypothetical protein